MGDESKCFPGEDPKKGFGGEGFSIFLDESEMLTFMEEGDFSSSRDLEHFSAISSGFEKKLKDGGGFSLLALSASGERISRDFTVLQVAHNLAKHGKKVLIVDCDFLAPGLSGLIRNIEDHGFLDLLLYGSSLKSVLQTTGIDNVNVTGPGSFPVSRTIPFALKEFSKVRDFLAGKADVVIYCSTLYAEDEAINPLLGMADSILLCCRIDDLEEGGLEKRISDTGEYASKVDLICFCSRMGDSVAEEVPETTSTVPDIEDEGEDILDLDPESEIPETIEEDKDLEPAFLEKSEEIDSMRKRGRGGISLPRVLAIGIPAVVVAFVVWWVMLERSTQEQEGAGKMTELVQKQQDVREMAARTGGLDSAEAGLVEGTGTEQDLAVEDNAGEETEGTAGQETGDLETELEGTGENVVDEEPVPEIRTPAPAGSYYTIHVASFKDVSRAGTETDYLEDNGYEVSVKEVDVKGGSWYRVYVGEFDNREEAEAIRVQLGELRRIAYTRVVTLKY
ncbi:MAG: SPOR domain-containing protein [Candidatus Krumholzibacteria bacterium]|nr:SPOR domain-containing protein [Candidatus Krumholzibacteria bacterium]